MRRIQKIAIKGVIGLLGVIAALILLEIGTRLFLSDDNTPGSSEFTCSSQLGWRGKPHYQTTFVTDNYEHSLSHNSAGMHDEEHPQAKPENTFRILMLGDSFVRAGQVTETETAHQVLENLLNQRGDLQKFEVISAGITGWGTGQELIYYSSEGRRYEPDLVLLMLYFGNDIIDNLPGHVLTADGENCYAPYFTLCNEQLDHEPWPYVPGLSPALGTCSWGRKTLSAILHILYLHSEVYNQLEPLLTANQPHFDQLPYYPLYIPENHELFDYGWQLTLALIGQLQQQVEADGATFGVVFISPIDVINISRLNPEARKTLYYEKVPDLQKAQLDRPNSRLATTLSQEGIHFLDLQPIFIQHINQTGEGLYYSVDKHWNIAGNRVAAEAIYHWLDDENNPSLVSDEQDVSE